MYNNYNAYLYLDICIYYGLQNISMATTRGHVGDMT